MPHAEVKSKVKIDYDSMEKWVWSDWKRHIFSENANKHFSYCERWWAGRQMILNASISLNGVNYRQSKNIFVSIDICKDTETMTITIEKVFSRGKLAKIEDVNKLLINYNEWICELLSDLKNAKIL